MTEQSEKDKHRSTAEALRLMTLNWKREMSSCQGLASRVEELEIVAEDAGMMIRRLLARLPDGLLKTQARDWLKRNQLEGSVLRAGAHTEEKE